MTMTTAKKLVSLKVDRMADVELHGGVWKDGGFLFPDGSRGSFTGDEIYRDNDGTLRSRPAFTAE
jgi:hypothetical protein